MRTATLLQPIRKESNIIESVKPLFRYPGGKYYALKILQPFWKNVYHDEYREPFVGGGSVFFDKNKVKFNWLNDIHKDLIITYKAIANFETRNKLIQLINNEIASPERHNIIKNMIPKSDIETAFKYFYLNRTSFSGKMKAPSWGYRPKRSLPPERWHERIIPCGQKLENVKLTNLDFEEVIKAPAIGNSVLMFVDPPYYSAKQESHYVHSFEKEDHFILARYLKQTKHKFFLTYDDAPEIRSLYSWAHIHPVEFYYRLDNSQHNGGARHKGFELAITNYRLKTEIQTTLSGNKVKISDAPVKSPFRFPGSKAQALKFILPILGKKEYVEYREPFFGGGAVFFAKPKVRFNWINDIDKELITTIKVICDENLRWKLIELLSNEVATKQRHIEIKQFQPKNNLEIAFKYFYLNRTSYSGIMNKPAWGYDDNKSVPPSRWGLRIEEASNKLKGIKITCQDFEEVISAPSRNKVMMFVDPPYYFADQKRAYTFHFTIKDHERLVSILRETKHYFCLTYDDCEPIRKLYSWARIHQAMWRYHTANSNKASRKMGNELIITNF